MSKKIQKWRCGEGGIVAAVIWRAKLDWQGASHITPEEAVQMAYGVPGYTLALATSRFAVRRGFPCPADEIMAFVQSDWLLDLISMVGVESLAGRIKGITEGDHVRRNPR